VSHVERIHEMLIVNALISKPTEAMRRAEAKLDSIVAEFPIGEMARKMAKMFLLTLGAVGGLTPIETIALKDRVASKTMADIGRDIGKQNRKKGRRKS
jgi:hypothetical protein